ncbi:hypothetical protein MNBD_GAMMA06-77 [hydrothermal vent metagenome]|uniref:Uncharacterized protein n=1 Tax=hydrothermal vent metagenome TaxID=652676 RepID=A0A3B0WAJ2_9ZZZZ
MAVFNRFLSNIFFIIVLLAAFLAVFNVQATDDEYLKQLELEVKNVHLDKSGQRTNNSAAHGRNAADNTKEKNWIGECDYADGMMPKNLPWEEFSSYLKQCSLATFVYYRRLVPELQHSVYDTYAETSTMKLSKLKKNILTYF